MARGGLKIEFPVPMQTATYPLAATLAGMIHGIENALRPDEEAKGAPEMDGSSLPLSIRDAIAATRKGTLLGPYLNQNFVSLYCNHREGELHHLEDHVTSRELDWYL